MNRETEAGFSNNDDVAVNMDSLLIHPFDPYPMVDPLKCHRIKTLSLGVPVARQLGWRGMIHYTSSGIDEYTIDPT
ncbi:MAG: hypothetical protein ACWA44_01405 [Thiotrichales bacterium]